MSSLSASSDALSNASFAEVKKARTRELALLEEMDQLKAALLESEADRDAALAAAAETKAECERRMSEQEVELKHARKVCAIVRTENERLRRTGQNKQEALHREANELRDELRASYNQRRAMVKNA